MGESIKAPVARAAELLAGAFGAPPAAIASAPGRVNLIGEHVDYHGGLVLPSGLAERTAVAVAAGGSGLRVVSEAAGAEPYVHAAVRALAEHLGEPLGDLDVAVAGDVAIGAGLASSAALAVATVAALAAFRRVSLPPFVIARIAHRAESVHVGVPCGVMDQIASACAPAGGAMLLDCRTLEWTPVPVPVDLVLADSGERHDLRDGAYAARRAEGERALELLRAHEPSLGSLVDIPPARLPALARLLPEPLGRRVRHVVNEHQRTRLASRALEADDPEGFGVLINASHASLRDLYECSTPRLDALVTAARALPHVLGARLTGAGWGGSVLVVCRTGSGGATAAKLRAEAVADDVRVVFAGSGVRVEQQQKGG